MANKNGGSLLAFVLRWAKPYRVSLAFSFLALAASVACELVLPVILRDVIDNVFLGSRRSAELIRQTMAFGVMLLGVFVFSIVQIYLMAWIGQKIMSDIRMKMLSHLLARNAGFFDVNPVGKLVTRMTSDVETVNELFTSIISALLKDLILMGGSIALLFVLDIRIAIVTLFALVPLGVLTFFFRIRSQKAYTRSRNAISAQNIFLSERISGMKIVQLFNLQNVERKKFRTISRENLRASMGEVHVFATFRPLIDLLSTLTVAVLLWGGAYLVGLQSVSLGIIAAAVSLVQKFYDPVKDLAEKFNITQSAAAGIVKINEILDSGMGEEKSADDSEAVLRVDAEFKNVFFSYKLGEPVLKGLSFKIPMGKTTAIVGYTGSGKTTVANLLTRIRDRDSGLIQICGTDIRDWSLKKLRKTVLPVSQDVILFAGTIRENIAFGDEYTDLQIEEACSLVQADDFIRQLPDGYGYQIKENGSNISMGQRQLLAFARAVIRSPGMIILDEASSHIDSGTEFLIERGIEGLLKGRTALVIAHRLSTVRKADHIIVLSGGRIAEQGTHETLLERKGLYYNFYQLQFVRND